MRIRTARHFGISVPCGSLLLLVAGCPAGQQPDPNVRFIAFGDSSTTGTPSRGYPDLLREMLGVAVDTFANEGKGGETSAAGLDRLNGLFSAGIYPNATTLLYWEGGNDLIAFLKEFDPLLLLSPSDPNYPLKSQLTGVLDTAQANITAAIGAGRSAGLAVYVATYAPRPQFPLPCKALLIPVMLPVQAARANEYTLMLNDRIRQAAAGSGATLIDVAADPQLPADVLNWANCDHLSEQGNRLAATVFAQALAVATQPG